MHRSEPPDLALFAVFAVALFAPLAFVEFVGGGMTLANDVRDAVSGRPGWGNAVGRAVVSALCLLIPAAGLGYGARPQWFHCWRTGVTSCKRGQGVRSALSEQDGGCHRNDDSAGPGRPDGRPGDTLSVGTEGCTSRSLPPSPIRP
jgi:hypothetical protein